MISYSIIFLRQRRRELRKIYRGSLYNLLFHVLCNNPGDFKRLHLTKQKPRFFRAWASFSFSLSLSVSLFSRHLRPDDHDPAIVNFWPQMVFSLLTTRFFSHSSEKCYPLAEIYGERWRPMATTIAVTGSESRSWYTPPSACGSRRRRRRLR